MLSFSLAIALAVSPPFGDPAAARIGSKAHADAAVLQKLPRFDYQARTRWGCVEAMRAEDKVALPEMTRALDGDISQKRGEGLTWFEFEFAWDETRFITGSRPGDADLSISHRFGTRTDGWSRGEAKDHSRIHFCRARSVGRYWWAGGDDAGAHVESSYLRLTPQKWWWGESSRRTNQALTHRPLAGATWATLPAQPFADEPCDVVEVSNQYGRFERLWVGQKSGRLRGVLIFRSQGSRYATLTRFDDYREVAPGVWVPFSEAHVFVWPSEKAKGKWQLVRRELRVMAARTGVDLAARYDALLPKPGDPVQDQRFAAEVNTKFDPKRPDADIQKEEDATYAERLKDAELVRALTEPVARLVGKTAPPLPAEGWVGGKRPDLAGKPHLVHFWATWCGPCKNDLPVLKELAASGVVVVGVHPAGTPADEVAKVVADRKLGYPTLVSSDTGKGTVTGYPVGMFPYCVFVDDKGNVAAHGPLGQVLKAVGRPALTPAKP